ncbi:hypothetical protein BKA62DRAFT_833894 [Auriculariales sp. MPI-PUGE-AT-0066]|nr:hypothetical protein BKA62DRAFT_833894 [Auriculariales sp. MPI-PUGE-AT-0066]
MIIDPKTLDEDAPPAYDQVTTSGSGTSGSQQLSLETKRPLPEAGSPIRSETALDSASPASALFGPRPGRGSPQSALSSSSSWFPISFLGVGSSKTDRDVKQTVIGLVRDLVHHGGESPDAIGILQSCAEACRARGLSLENILQEASIEGHTPLYWAILKRSGSGTSQQISLVDLLMSFPLAPPALADARAACLLTSDDNIFQRLRHSPGCAGLNAAEELLLGAQPADEVIVENAVGTHGAFKVTMHLVHLQKRMRVSRKLAIEFIARGRIWTLAFQIATPADRHHAPPGSWIVTVAIDESSPTTLLDSMLQIQPMYPVSPVFGSPNQYPVRSTTPAPLSTPTAAGAAAAAWNSLKLGGSTKKLEPISLRLRSGPSPLGERDWRDATRRRRAMATLSAVTGGAGLEFDGCPHLNLDGSLDATFEAELTHRSEDAECNIM